MLFVPLSLRELIDEILDFWQVSADHEKEKGRGGGKDKDGKRKWGIGAAESGPLRAQHMKRLCIQFTPENGPGNESWHHSTCLKMANGFYIYFLVFFFWSNRTNHDHVGGLKQLKFLFPLLSQPEVWDKGVGRVGILGRHKGPILVTSLTFVCCLQLLPSLLFMPVSPCVFICPSPLDFLCYLIFFGFFLKILSLICMQVVPQIHCVVHSGLKFMAMSLPLPPRMLV